MKRLNDGIPASGGLSWQDWHQLGPGWHRAVRARKDQPSTYRAGADRPAFDTPQSCRRLSGWRERGCRGQASEILVGAWMANRGSQKRAKRTSAQQRVCVLVLGMHRSGTRALTRLLSIAGARLPASLMSPSPANATGFWESFTLMKFHESLLAVAHPPFRGACSSKHFKHLLLNCGRFPKLQYWDASKADKSGSACASKQKTARPFQERWR